MAGRASMVPRKVRTPSRHRRDRWGRAEGAGDHGPGPGACGGVDQGDVLVGYGFAEVPGAGLVEHEPEGALQHGPGQWQPGHVGPGHRRRAFAVAVAGLGHADGEGLCPGLAAGPVGQGRHAGRRSSGRSASASIRRAVSG